MDDETLKTYGYVISSSYREKSVKSLNDGDKIPTDLAEDIGIRTNHISKVLREHAKIEYTGLHLRVKM